MRRRGRSVAVVIGAALMAVGCTSTGVSISRSDQTPESTVVTEPPPTTTTIDPGDLPAIGPVAWSSCPDYESPWQCGTIEVPLNYGDPTARQISLALIRLPAQDSSKRIGSFVLNPGGPGGSGIFLAYSEGADFPQRVLDRFDIVGFDPRGVGASTPVTCPAGFDPEVDSFDDCIDASRDMLPYLGTNNVARDLDMIRRAVGDQQLTYLGYSYGTTLGAAYADLFPAQVRAMVLDGATDPDAGKSNTEAGGSDFYADQDFDATIATFEDLCDATTSCPAGPHTRQLVERVSSKVRSLSTAQFPGFGSLNRGDVDDLLVNAMYSAADWPILAIALKDADEGDASTLAAFYSWLLYGFPADVSGENNLSFANIAITCADFSSRGFGAYDCQSFPDTAEALSVVTPVTLATPVLVVGTKGDPATPARYAPRMARALGDAVSIEWEGAGHTATLTSDCITDIVADYIVDTTVPSDGTTCPFVAGSNDVADAAEAVFADPDPTRASSALVDVLVAAGDSAAAAECVAEQLVRRGTARLVVHELLGVESPELLSLRGLVERGCRLGG